MPEDKKSWMQMAIGMMKKDKKQKNEVDKIKEATKKKNKDLEDLYSWGKGGK